MRTIVLLFALWALNPSPTCIERQNADCPSSSRAGSHFAGSVIPLLSPLRIVPGLLESVLRLLRTRFDTRGVIEVRELFCFHFRKWSVFSRLD